MREPYQMMVKGWEWWKGNLHAGPSFGWDRKPERQTKKIAYGLSKNFLIIYKHAGKNFFIQSWLRTFLLSLNIHIPLCFFPVQKFQVIQMLSFVGGLAWYSMLWWACWFHHGLTMILTLSSMWSYFRSYFDQRYN
jgi:hypothetical protein